MRLILNIDTALETASVCIARDGASLAFASNPDQRDHASWLSAGIEEVMNKSGYRLQDLAAIAVSIGPGSYTGLRVGLSSAKGMCFALNIPLLAVNTLEQIAFAAKEEVGDLLCPVIDARRMEVYMALYDRRMRMIIQPKAMIADANSFDETLAENEVVFCGNAVNKLKTVITHPRAVFSNSVANATHIAEISTHLFKENRFADLAYSEPFYLKEFYSPNR